MMWNGNLFSFFSMFSQTLFVIIFVIFIIVLAKQIKQWNKNNHSPIFTVEAAVVAKRQSVTHHHSGDSQNAMYTTSSVVYYITFQVASGDRMEFSVPSHEFGMIIEGDCGRLTFQGTRFHSFERDTMSRS